jgi:hypothetical protein
MQQKFIIIIIINIIIFIILREPDPINLGLARISNPSL